MFTFKIEPRFSETDALGHINNTSLPVWFEEARTDLFRIFNPSLKRETWNLILKKYEVEMLNQIVHGKPVTIETGIQRIGGSSFVVHQKASQNGLDVAIGESLMVYFDYKTLSPIQIPGEIKQRLLEHTLEPEA